MREIRRCPVTGADVEAGRPELISRAAGLAYPVRDGFPVLLADEARKLS